MYNRIATAAKINMLDSLLKIESTVGPTRVHVKFYLSCIFVDTYICFWTFTEIPLSHTKFGFTLTALSSGIRSTNGPPTRLDLALDCLESPLYYSKAQSFSWRLRISPRLDLAFECLEFSIFLLHDSIDSISWLPGIPSSYGPQGLI